MRFETDRGTIEVVVGRCCDCGREFDEDSSPNLIGNTYLPRTWAANWVELEGKIGDVSATCPQCIVRDDERRRLSCVEIQK